MPIFIISYIYKVVGKSVKNKLNLNLFFPAEPPGIICKALTNHGYFDSL